MKGMLEPVFEEKVTGYVEIRQTYKVSKLGTIGGGYVTDGYIQRDSGVRIIRDGIVSLHLSSVSKMTSSRSNPDSNAA
jgi:translation initiation factor IF-2